MHFIGIFNRDGGTFRTMDMDAFSTRAVAVFAEHGHTLDTRVIEGAELIEALERIKNSFNSYPLDRLAIAGAVASFEDHDHFDRSCKAVIATREKLVREMKSLGFEVIPSSANFIFARHVSHDAEMLALALRQQSIIVRHFKMPRIDQYLRITVGTDEQCDILLSVLREIFSA